MGCRCARRPIYLLPVFRDAIPLVSSSLDFQVRPAYHKYHAIAFLFQYTVSLALVVPLSCSSFMLYSLLYNAQ